MGPRCVAITPILLRIDFRDSVAIAEFHTIAVRLLTNSRTTFAYPDWTSRRSCSMLCG
jgi:hypothetical protein